MVTKRSASTTVCVARCAMFLRDAASKLAKEHATRDRTARERARAKEDEDARVERMRIEREEALRVERAARRREMEEASRRRAAQRETYGASVSYSATLAAEASRAAEARGIRARKDDKAQLPSAARDALGVERSGRAFFRIERGSRVTHVGVLDYGDVRERAIGLPIKVMRALGAGASGSFADGEDATVRATYVTLPLGTRMTLKPKKNDFARDFLSMDGSGGDVRAVLERVMMGRSCATVGDEIVVEDGPRPPYELVVTAVEPSVVHSDDEEEEDEDSIVVDGVPVAMKRAHPAAVSLLETDVEVDLEPSDEYDEVIRRERRRKEEFEAAKAKLAEREVQKTKDIELRQANIAALKASIKPESPDDASGDASPVAKVRFSLPNGRVTTRRFATDGSRTTQDIYDYVRSMDDDLFDIEFDLVSRGGASVSASAANVDASAHMETFFVKKRST